MLARSINARVVIINVHSPIFIKSQNELEQCREIALSKKESEEDLKNFTTILLKRRSFVPIESFSAWNLAVQLPRKLQKKRRKLMLILS